METVNNLTSAASRLIWGEQTKTSENETQGKEPLSGEVGNTAKGEPYDKGNAGKAFYSPHLHNGPEAHYSGVTDTSTTEPTSTSTTEASSIPTTEPTSTSTSTGLESSSRSGATETGITPTTEPSSTSTGLQSTGLQSSSGSGATETGRTPATGPIRPEHDTDKTGVTSVHHPTSATSTDKPTSSNDASASVGAAPESGSAVKQKQQGADRPLDEPGSRESERIKASKKEAEGVANDERSDLGPIPFREKAKAGDVSAGGEDDGPQKESHGTGTGEQYVMTSGMKADGGDFDASKPGAGREADRMLLSSLPTLMDDF